MGSAAIWPGCPTGSGTPPRWTAPPLLQMKRPATDRPSTPILARCQGLAALLRIPAAASRDARMSFRSSCMFMGSLDEDSNPKCL
jgi:hypothetical protein